MGPTYIVYLEDSLSCDFLHIFKGNQKRLSHTAYIHMVYLRYTIFMCSKFTQKTEAFPHVFYPKVFLHYDTFCGLEENNDSEGFPTLLNIQSFPTRNHYDTEENWKQWMLSYIVYI